MHNENEEDDDEGRAHLNDKQKKDRKSRLLLTKEIKSLKAKFPSSLERLFYMNLIK
jgi:hypothetical protein